MGRILQPLDASRAPAVPVSVSSGESSVDFTVTELAVMVPVPPIPALVVLLTMFASTDPTTDTEEVPVPTPGLAIDKSITLPDDTLVGAVGLKLEEDTGIAELGYWIGVPYWGNGYATEAAETLLDFGFDTLALERIWARAFVRNPASSRVLQKLGMKHEGTLRRCLRKNHELLDAEMYGILREERDPPGGTPQPPTEPSDEPGEPS